MFCIIIGVRVTDLHKEHVDEITIPSKEGAFFLATIYCYRQLLQTLTYEIFKMS